MKNLSNLKQENIWLNINKEKDFSSAKIVAIIKSITKAKKVGHGGTLDPMATGVLPICLNKACKETNQIMDKTKKYFFQISWGKSFDSDDATGKIINSSDKRAKTSELIAILSDFLGEISQTPSKFSALKINGKRAYELARKGIEFETKSRKIFIYSIKLIENNIDFANFEIVCSKGTYIRTISHDICEKLNICGHVSILTRLKVGEFDIKNSLSLQQFRSKIFSNKYLNK